MRRGVFAAYNGQHRGRDNDEYARHEGTSSTSTRPDESLPDVRNGFQRGGADVTMDSMQRSYQNRLRDANNHRIASFVMSKIQEEQERSRFGQKALTLEEEMSGDDEDFVVMNTCQSVFDQVNQPQQMVVHHHHYEKKKKKGSKKKRSSSTSSSSSSSSEESSVSRRRKKEKKKSKKEKKRERKRKHSDELAESSADEGRSRSKKQPIVYSEFDHKRNPWKLLRKNEWVHKPMHMVVDTFGDPENAKYDSSHRGDVPDYRAPNSEDSPFWRVFSELYKGLLSNPESSAVGKDQRAFSARVMKQWGKCAPERVFRNRANDKFENYVKISHAPCPPDEEGAVSLGVIKYEMDPQMLSTINIEDFEHIMRSQNASYEEALESDVQTRYSILQAMVLREPDNVDAWLKFVDIQREMQGKNESGDPKAPVQNTKALFEKMEEVIKRAIDNKNVSSKNPRMVELHLKYLKILEEHFSPQSEAVVDKWARCENRFVNSITMWRENIKMRQNDRAVFDLRKMVLMDSARTESRLPLIDHCIKRLVEIKNGTIKSHAMMEGTEQFLVDLLVQRCRLQVVAGHVAKAVAVLQALAEFHFFRPEVYKNFRPDTKPHVMQQELKKGFKTFWTSGLPRIGEPGANGWLRFERSDVDSQHPKHDEAEVLEQKWSCMHEEEKALMAKYKGLGLSPVEIRRRLEKFRAKWFWFPVHFKHDDEKLYEHKARIVSFEELEPLLFSFNDTNCVKDLIFKLLHIFGVPIPDIFIETQENILRQFSRSYFHSNSPISLDLNGFDKFIDCFVTQIAESPMMDSPRIYTALITSISNSPLSTQKKYNTLRQLVRGKIQTLKRHGKETKLSREVQLSLYLTAFEEMIKIKQEHNDECTDTTDESNPPITESEECKMCLAVLRMNLDAKDRSLWEIGETGDVDKRKEKLFFMRFAVFLVRQLPFSTDPDEGKKENRAVIARNGTIIGYLATKREFLLSLFYHGRVLQVAENAETKQKAYKNFVERLSHPAALILDDPLRWIGDENELVFELCAYYNYEFPISPLVRISSFVRVDSPFYTTKLAELLKERPCVQETRIAILQHIVATSSFFTPGELREQLSQLVQRFPHNIPILQALLSVGSDFHRRRFLAQHPGTDDRSRLIRTCGRIFAAHHHYLAEHKRYYEQKFDNQAFRTLLYQYVHLLRKAAEENCGSALPDDYIWVFLMQHITSERTMLPRRVIDEVFTIGQGRCPWSKQFLMESLRGCCDRTDPSVTMVNATMKTHGISVYCTDPEVQLLLENV
ncbi:hypothetical protein niasHS_011143 [Heterodera schachtii]|uniref:Uncharacterized protein n=1 Tax=Heterodera schachtii TaxID=97005 RepID=A0ABD2IVP6_HETSC